MPYEVPAYIKARAVKYGEIFPDFGASFFEAYYSEYGALPSIRPDNRDMLYRHFHRVQPVLASHGLLPQDLQAETNYQPATVDRLFNPGRSQPPYYAKATLLDNGTYVLKGAAQPGWNTDIYGHTPVWLVFDDKSRKLLKGGFATKKDATEWSVANVVIPPVLEPEVLSQYPHGEMPEESEEVIGVPGAPMPPPKGLFTPVIAEGKKYPLVMSMREFQTVWRPKGWKIIFIGPTSTWRQEWGPWEAIRDLVQNALDETESYRSWYDNEGFWIVDKGKGVAVADFLLGPPKLKPDYARGRFGEGMKIAALALVRLGYPVHVLTVGRELWMIFIEQEAGEGTKVQSLAALWRNGGTEEGTRFHIIGYRGPSFSDRFTINLPKSAIVSTAPSKVNEPGLRYNSIIQAELQTPRIYARDIYMRNINSVFSYDLWGFEMSPDRFGPKNEEDMWKDMGRTWAFVKDPKLIKVMLQMVSDPPLLNTDESHLLDMLPYDMGYYLDSEGHNQSYRDKMAENKDIWQQAWDDTFGSDTVLQTGSKYDPIVRHLGYKSQVVSWNVRDGLSIAIKTDVALMQESQERLREVEVIPDSELSPQQLASLKLARSIAQYVRGNVKGVVAAIIPPASNRVRTAGMWGTTTQEIYIAVEQLNSGRATVDTDIHELAHATSGAEDGTEAHAREMTRIAGEVVYLTCQRQFDELVNPPFSWY
jgi:hypothetical protein